jgi:hypothetical protein
VVADCLTDGALGRPFTNTTTTYAQQQQVFQLCDLADEAMQATVLALARKTAPSPDGGWFRQSDLDDLRDRIKVRICPFPLSKQQQARD